MAVIDTNVLVSSLFSKDGKSYPALVIDSIFRGLIIPLYNEDIVQEYRDVLSRQKFNFPKSLIEELLSGIVESGLNTERTAICKEEFSDKDDLVFYEIKMSVEDSYLVTGNLKHFPNNPLVVNPAEMVEILKNRKLLH